MIMNTLIFPFIFSFGHSAFSFGFIGDDQLALLYNIH